MLKQMSIGIAVAIFALALLPKLLTGNLLLLALCIAMLIGIIAIMVF